MNLRRLAINSVNRHGIIEKNPLSPLAQTSARTRDGRNNFIKIKVLF